MPLSLTNLPRRIEQGAALRQEWMMKLPMTMGLSSLLPNEKKNGYMGRLLLHILLHRLNVAGRQSRTDAIGPDA